MAPIRPRNSSKRSSSSASYASTITTAVFVALCVGGVYMLTSNSVENPQITSRVTESTTNVESLVLPSSEVQNVVKKDQPGYEDNPGNLPVDAIKINDAKTDNAVEEMKQNEKQIQLSEESTMTQKEQANQVIQEQSFETGEGVQDSQDKKHTDHANQEQSGESGESSQDLQDKKQENQEQSSGTGESSQESQDKTADENNMQDLQDEKQANQANQEQINQTGESSLESQDKKADEIDLQDKNADEIQKDKEQNQQLRDDSGDNYTQDSQNQESNSDQMLQQTEAAGAENSQEDQNLKSFKEQQQKQLKEDEGIQTTAQESENQGTQTAPQETENRGIQTAAQESENQVTEADQEKRIEQQKQKQEKQQEGGNENTLLDEQKHQKQQDEHDQQKPSESTFEDQTQPGTQQSSSQETKKEEPQDDKSVQESQDQQNQNQDTKQDTTESSQDDSSFPGGGVSIPKESKESKKSWSTQATESENQKERRKEESDSKESLYGYTWEICNVTAGADYIPCLDNGKAISHLRSSKHFEHRERHCPEDPPTCLVPAPQGYKTPIKWPQSRDKIWYHNVPHTYLAEFKGHQNWVKVTGEFLTFPGGGTQFINGALHYIDFLQGSVPEIAWGKHTRVILDVGCGVASFGGFLFDRDVLTMSFAPKDEHEAQVQFALERGIPAISAVMGSQRLPFPSIVFDVVHCARCRVPWHIEGGRLLLELNRVLRPGGYFIWSATPVYQKLPEDVEIWEAMSALTVSMCWELVTIKKDARNFIGAAIYRKPTSNDCYDQRKKSSPPMCTNDDDPNAAWYIPLQACIHRVPTDETERGQRWPKMWPRRVQAPPYWLNSSQMGIYGKPAPQDFAKDYKHWKVVVNKSYKQALGINWSNIRNVMDMRAVYGGLAAALKDMKVWVMNVVNVDSPDTLPIIYERGLFGIYHDWCESFSTYPRTYDLLHADHLFSKLKKRCKLPPVMAEVDRMVRPGGKLIVRDESNTIGEVENLLKSLRWEVQITFSKDQEGLLSAQKGKWRPHTTTVSS